MTDELEKKNCSITLQGIWRHWDDVLSIGDVDWTDIRNPELKRFLGRKKIAVEIKITKLEAL